MRSAARAISGNVFADGNVEISSTSWLPWAHSRQRSNRGKLIVVLLTPFVIVIESLLTVSALWCTTPVSRDTSIIFYLPSNEDLWWTLFVVPGVSASVFKHHLYPIQKGRWRRGQVIFRHGTQFFRWMCFHARLRECFRGRWKCAYNPVRCPRELNVRHRISYF